jgi:small subunit ribosomal protein S8
MAHTDPISDMLTRIRNAISVGKHNVTMPHSRLKETIAHELVRATFVDEVKVDGSGVSKMLTITINQPGKSPRISTIEKLSRPGRRVYANVSEIPTIKNGRGVVLVSTSKGIMTGAEARKNQVGGELICKVF